LSPKTNCSVPTLTGAAKDCDSSEMVLAQINRPERIRESCASGRRCLLSCSWWYSHRRWYERLAG
jgi:hypothetical protein